MTGILVTGGTGQVATELGVLARTRGIDLRVVGRPAFDFDRPETLDAVIAGTTADLVVNAAAYTAVDRAETEQDKAWRANHAGPAQLAALCAARGARLIHLSTDYVFDGAKAAPYLETDPPCPTGVYGASKLAGERAVIEAAPDTIILRTAWVYAATGRNFVLTMLNAARRGAALQVVADQFGCPTAATDLAAAILDIAAHPHWRAGIYHAAGGGSTSWHGFAEAIFARAATHGLPVPTLSPIAAADWPTPARRPANSRLDCTRLHDQFGVSLPPWGESVDRTIDTIFAAATVS